MKKRLLVAVLCFCILLSLAACSRKEGDTVVPSKYIDLEIVQIVSNGDGIFGKIFVDRDTGVLYLWYHDNAQHGQALTPIYNADGSLKNISDFEN
jgi:hypothetical protein